MKLHLASFGGIGGLRIAGPLDTEDLAPDLAATARKLVALTSVDREPEKGDASPLPDALGYELTWSVEEAPGQDVTHRQLFDEQSAPPRGPGLPARPDAGDRAPQGRLARGAPASLSQGPQTG